MKIIFTIGLPASGKTTWAIEQKDFTISERDEIRKDLFDCQHLREYYSKSNIKHKEQLVTNRQNEIISECISNNQNLIISDTNLNKTFLQNKISWIKTLNSDVEIEIVSFLDVSVEECIKRDNKRLHNVGSEVIRNMYNKYFWDYPEFNKGLKLADNGNPYLPEAIIVDIDGTIAEKGKRSPYDFSRVSEDTPHYDVIKTIQSLCKQNNYKIFFFSGREDSCYDDTLDWIKRHFTNIIDNPYELHMRKLKDSRVDWIVKYEMYDRVIRNNYNVHCVFDDRDQVVWMFRKIGLRVFQVNYGNF